jgi:hypothetical protein
MLRLLLDEQIAPVVAEGVRRLLPKRTILSMYEWEQGAYLGQPDETILSRAAETGWILITFDLRSIAPLLAAWREHGIDHAGVIFVPTNSIRSSDFGLLVRSIASFVQANKAIQKWGNSIHFLRPATDEHSIR